MSYQPLMGENRSSDSSDSTLTHCTYSAKKRKRECESDCDSFVRPVPMALPLSSYRHVGAIFQELARVRLLSPPYHTFHGWEDEKLWCEIESNVNKKDRYVSPITSGEILELLAAYHASYLRGERLPDESQNHDMLLAFGPLLDTNDCLLSCHIQEMKKSISKSSKGCLQPYGIQEAKNSISKPRSYCYVCSSDSNDAIVGYEEDFSGRIAILEKAKEWDKSLKYVSSRDQIECILNDNSTKGKLAVIGLSSLVDQATQNSPEPESSKKRKTSWWKLM